jgi:hypothetical protein
MLTQDEARKRVFDHINKSCPLDDDYIDIIDALTVERPYGWFFMYDCRRFIETGNPVYAVLIGNVPLLVDRSTGALHEIPWRFS